MNIRESKRIMQLAMKANVPFLLVGHSGIGKSQIIESLTKEQFPDHTFVSVFASQCDVGDFTGIPGDVEVNITNADGTVEKVRTTSWARAEWMPKGPCVIFLDELNNARTDVESAMLQLVLEKRIHTHALHPDSFVCAAINPATSEYTTANVISSALAKRFVVIPFQPLTSELISWAETTKRYHPSVIKFLNHMPISAGLDKPLETTIKVEPCPRLWEMVSRLINVAAEDNANWQDDGELIKNLLSTTVGVETAALYVAFLESQDKPLTFEEIIKDQDKAIKRFKDIQDQMRGDLISETNNNFIKGIVGIVNELSPVLTYDNPVLDVDSQDDKIKQKALKALNKNVGENLGVNRVKLDKALAFLDHLPNDLFFKLSYDILTRDPSVKDATQEQQIKILDGHFTVCLYLYSDSLINNHKTLYSKWAKAAGTYTSSDKDQLTTEVKKVKSK